MENLLVCRDGHGLGGINNPVHIRLRNLPVPDRDDAVGVHAADMASRDAGVDRMNAAARHELRLFNSTLDRLYRGFDIDDDTPFQPP